MGSFPIKEILKESKERISERTQSFLKEVNKNET